MNNAAMTVNLPTISREFVVAGKATFTMEIPDAYAAQHGLKRHYTFKTRFKAGNDQFADAFFVSLMTGQDNESSFSYLGMLNPETGVVRTTAKSCVGGDDLVVRLLNRALALVWAGDTTPLTSAGFNVCHAGKCGRCNRKLTNPESLATGIGPECAGRKPYNAR